MKVTDMFGKEQFPKQRVLRVAGAVGALTLSAVIIGITAEGVASDLDSSLTQTATERLSPSFSAANTAEAPKHKFSSSPAVTSSELSSPTRTEDWLVPSIVLATELAAAGYGLYRFHKYRTEFKVPFSPPPNQQIGLSDEEQRAFDTLRQNI